jgi:branched-chain amino acid transport system ATP-binding protein
MLRVANLSTYYGRAHILDGVSFDVGTGEVVALLGRNGAGKSTTLKTLMGLVRASSGRISFAETEITGWAPQDVARAGLGYVPEERRIFGDLTVEENLDVGRQPKRDGAPEWTIEKLFQLFPNLAEARRRLGGRLSGGEQQMLAIARTLMGNPRAVLLDEPSEGLAPIIVEAMARTMQSLKREGMALVIAEPNLRFAGLVADRAYILEKGRIRYSGTLAELTASENTRAQYLAV